MDILRLISLVVVVVIVLMGSVYIGRLWREVHGEDSHFGFAFLITLLVGVLAIYGMVV